MATEETTADKVWPKLRARLKAFFGNGSEGRVAPDEPSDLRDVRNGIFALVTLIVAMVLLLWSIVNLWSPIRPSAAPEQVSKRTEAKRIAQLLLIYSESSSRAATTGDNPPDNVRPPEPTLGRITAAANNLTVIPDRYEYQTLFGRQDLSDDAHILWLVIIAGAIGGALHAISSGVMYLGTSAFLSRWASFYYSRPLIGSALGLIAYALLRSGLMPAVSVDGVAPFGPVAVAALMGLFNRPALSKLEQIFNAMFTPPGNDQNSLPVQALDVRLDKKELPLKTTDGEQVVNIRVIWPKAITADADLIVTGLPENAFKLEATTLKRQASDERRTTLRIFPDKLTPGELEVTVQVKADDQTDTDKVKLTIT